MRTKALILTAVLSAASLATSLAQVYSVNAVGYVNKVFPVGFSLISNPLDAGNNHLTNLFKDNVPDFVNGYRWNGSGFDIATYSFGAWDIDFDVPPGSGMFINTGTAFTNTFVGEVMQGNLQNPIPQGLSIKSSQVPQAGTATALGLTNLSDFDNLYKWNPAGGNYTIFTYSFGAWDPSEPNFDVGEAVFINANAATSWDRTFSVNTP